MILCVQLFIFVQIYENNLEVVCVCMRFKTFLFEKNYTYIVFIQFSRCFLCFTILS